MQMTEKLTDSDFDHVLHMHQGEIRAYLASLGVPLDMVDDLAQEVFLAWFRAPDQRPPEVIPVRWLKGIARRMALNFFRTSKRREDQRLAIMAELLATEPVDLPLATDTEAASAQGKCLDEVSTRNRENLRLRDDENLPSHSVGERMNELIARFLDDRHNLNAEELERLTRHLEVNPLELEDFSVR